MVGVLSFEREAEFGQILAPYLADPQNLFVVSSDFCHWGQRFRYTHYDEAVGPIYKSIEKLDREGMELIEKLDPEPFSTYLRKYSNTICGRHPIGVFLQVSCCSSAIAPTRNRYVLIDPYSPSCFIHLTCSA